MAVQSAMLPLGTAAPHFLLPDVLSGREVSLREAESAKATLVMFICNHCPYVKHVQHELSALGRDYLERGVKIFAISSNDALGYPEDGPEPMARVAREVGYRFPYLYDESQTIARAYGAVCTPEFFLFDASLVLVYRGQLDDSRPGNGTPVTGADLREAIDAVLDDQPVPADQKPSVGCSIKWRA
jgi:peroxiredoxin